MIESCAMIQVFANHSVTGWSPLTKSHPSNSSSRAWNAIRCKLEEKFRNKILIKSNEKENSIMIIPMVEAVPCHIAAVYNLPKVSIIQHCYTWWLPQHLHLHIVQCRRTWRIAHIKVFMMMMMINDDDDDDDDASYSKEAMNGKIQEGGVEPHLKQPIVDWPR